MATAAETLRIAPLGRPYVYGAAALALLIMVYFGPRWSVPAWALTAALGYFMRDPVRVTPSVPLGVVSPVDGCVISVGTDTDPYLQRDAMRMRLRMNRRGAYVIRAPIEGKVVEQWYARIPGGMARPVAPPGCRAAWIKTDEGDDVTLAVYRGCPLCRPRLPIGTGARVGHGQRYGFLIGGGAVVDVFLPPGTRLDRSPRDRVVGGTTIIATLIHK